MNQPDLQNCPHRPACDGCPRFERDPKTAFEEKAAAVDKAIERFDLHEWPKVLVHPSTTTLGYRNRARLRLRPDGTRGFFRRGSRDFVPIDRCAVHSELVEANIAKLAPLLANLGAGYLDLRAAGSNAIATFGFASAPSEENREALKAAASDTLAVHLNVGGGDALLAGEHEVLAGPAALDVPLGAHVFAVPPTAFFQVNTEVLEAMHGVIRPWVAGCDELLDIHCGVGVHGIACAPAGCRVQGFDTAASAVAAAQANAARNQVDGTYAVASDADWPGMERAPESGLRAAVVNPARAGLHRRLPNKLNASGVSRLAYVSCDPATFLRDAEQLENQGFALKELHAFDMMPRTDHLELVGLFERTEPRAFWHDLSHDATGAKTGEGGDVWIAIVVGKVGRKATLPGGALNVERLRSLGEFSVVRIRSAEAVEASVICKALRRWKHALVGDQKNGLRSVNFRWNRDENLNRPALHRVVSGKNRAKIPCFLVGLMQLTPRVLGAP